jgi:hypothetical protein
LPLGASAFDVPTGFAPVKSTAVVVRNNTAGTRFSDDLSGPAWHPTQ